MAYLTLTKLRPLDPVTGTRVDIYVAGANDRRITGLGGFVWVPALVEPPELRMSLFNGDFQAAVRPGEAKLPISMTAVEQIWPDASRYVWAGAPVEICVEEPGTAWPWTIRFIGKANGFTRDGQKLTLSAAVDVEPFAANVLTATYAGTGGLEGGQDLAGRVKPLAIGWAKNVEPVMIDAANSVYQFSAYGAIEAVTTLFERGADFGASLGDHATYAALVAATIAPGRWATCLASGLVRLGAPQAGVITADIKGHKIGGATPRLTGAVISAIASIAGISSSLIETSSLSLLDTAIPFPINLVVTEQTNFADLASRLVLPCNWQAGVSLLGKFFASSIINPELWSSSSTGWVSGGEHWIIETPTPGGFTLDALGRQVPQVVKSSESDVSPPYWRTTLGANRSWRVHTADEIAFQAKYEPKGPYDPATTYREGNAVTTADGSLWIYVNPTSTAGHAPPDWPTTSNAYWENLSFNSAGIDGILSISEKISYLIPEDARLEGMWTALSAAAATAGVSTTTAAAARTAWQSERNGLSPAWNDTTADTYLDRDIFRGALVAYSDALSALSKAISEAMPVTLQVTIAPPAGATIYCDSAGAPKSGQLPKVLTPSVTRGGNDIRTDASVSYAISAPSQVDASVNNTGGSADKGRITIGSGFTGPGTVQLTVTVDGTAYGPFPISVDRSNDPPPVVGGGGGSGPAYDSTFNTVSSTSFNAISDELGPLTLGSGQKLVVTAPLDYNLSASSSISRYLKANAQYWDGSAWQDFPSSPVNGSNTTWNASDYSGETGTINLSQEKTGLAAGSYKVRLVAALSAAGASAVISIASGTMTYTIV